MASSGKSTVRDEISQIQAEVQKLGRQDFFDRIQQAAREAICRLPTDGEIKKLDPLSLRYIEQIKEVISAGLTLSDQGDEELISFAREVAWAKLSSNIASNLIIAMDNNGDGGGSGKTCVSQCADEYNKCVDENDCDTSGWICLCCTPCSLQYMACVARCCRIGGGLGPVIA
jgi:hypothetical protein